MMVMMAKLLAFPFFCFCNDITASASIDLLKASAEVRNLSSMADLTIDDRWDIQDALVVGSLD